MRKRQILAGLVVLLIGLYMSGCMKLRAKGKTDISDKRKRSVSGV